jgi:hypothetical protein
MATIIGGLQYGNYGYATKILTNANHPYTIPNAGPNFLGNTLIVHYCTNTSPLTINLPSAVTASTGFFYIIKNNGTSTVTLSGGTIDGEPTLTLNQYNGVKVVSNGTNWFIEHAGSSGTSGTSGSNGTNGSSGSNGTNGSSGSNGTNGSSGTSGSNGTNGSSGTSGSNGTNGSSGSNGTDGSSGSNGSSGSSGSNGTDGSSGSSGSNGTDGSSGSNGTNGSSGTSGSNGTNGSSGSNGTNGSSGSNGTNGSSGTSGSNGTSGDSIFAQTGSFWNATKNVQITGSLHVIGNLTAQQYIVSSSVYYVTESTLSGSNTFGNDLLDYHNFTGSVHISGSLGVTGNVSGSAFYQVSSRTLKTNIEPFTLSGIDLINEVKVVEFNYLNDLNNKHIGFIAEDTPTQLSTLNKNVMDTNSTVGVLIKAIQELSEEVKKLKGN